MSSVGLVAVSFGDAPAAAALAALGAANVVLARDAASPAALLAEAAAGERFVLWLPAWARVTAPLVSAVQAWCARDTAGARIARARVRWVCGGHAEIGGPVWMLLSAPGSVSLAGELPHPIPAARADDLTVPLEVELPDDLAQHLEGVNQQSSVAARLRYASGLEAQWAGLAWRPALLLLRALASASGSRRAALPHAVVEAYREVLATAKLWELAHGTALR